MDAIGLEILNVRQVIAYGVELVVEEKENEHAKEKREEDFDDGQNFQENRAVKERNEDVILEPSWQKAIQGLDLTNINKKHVVHNHAPSLVNVGTSQKNRKHLAEMNIEKIQNEVLLVPRAHAVVDPSTVKKCDWSHGQ